MTGSRQYWAVRNNETGQTARVLRSTLAGDAFTGYWVELHDQTTQEIPASLVGAHKRYSWHEIDGMIDGWYITVRQIEVGVVEVSMSREGWPSYTFAYRSDVLLHGRRPLGVEVEDEQRIGVTSGTEEETLARRALAVYHGS